MTFLFLSLPRDAKLLDVFRLHHKIARPLLGLHESILRKPSPLPVVERELIAAFVSALNSCAYCAGVHEATTHRFGIVPDLVAALLNDIGYRADRTKDSSHHKVRREAHARAGSPYAEDANAVYGLGRSCAA